MIALASTMVAAFLGLSAYFYEAATPTLRNLPYALWSDPVYRADWLNHEAAQWPFWLALTGGVVVCVGLLIRFIRKGRVR